MVQTKRRTGYVLAGKIDQAHDALEYATYACIHVIGVEESNAPLALSRNGGGAIWACWDDRDLRYGGRSERLRTLWRGDGTIRGDGWRWCGAGS